MSPGFRTRHWSFVTPMCSGWPTSYRPNAVTASLEESAKASQDRGLVVITKRLILQPNCGHRPDAAWEAERVAEKKAEEAHQKKLDLLADMTKELQVILQRLSDKNLADANRERYQSMAQTIQNRMASLSCGPEKERTYAVPQAQEKYSEQPVTANSSANTAASTNAIVVSPANSA
ncbi:Hypothetical protein SCF082_LOCUS12562 [Durusdinium trenchii]|uniref:Uncharacterized protein n=1 Tax=Durusdinium trenchii TaxID=1381693 RepID=A0ABP0JLF0_9DINO